MIVLWAGISLSHSLCSSIVFSLIIVEKHYTIAKINKLGEGELCRSGKYLFWRQIIVTYPRSRKYLGTLDFV